MNIALDHVPLEIEADQGFGQTRIPSVESYTGDMRGIQGHHNSCYLDATIFGLFALSDVFDSLFLGDSKDDVGESIKRILWRRIVNPLRKWVCIIYSFMLYRIIPCYMWCCFTLPGSEQCGTSL